MNVTGGGGACGITLYSATVWRRRLRVGWIVRYGGDCKAEDESFRLWNDPLSFDEYRAFLLHKEKEDLTTICFRLYNLVKCSAPCWQEVYGRRIEERSVKKNWEIPLFRLNSGEREYEVHYCIWIWKKKNTVSAISEHIGKSLRGTCSKHLYLVRFWNISTICIGFTWFYSKNVVFAYAALKEDIVVQAWWGFLIWRAHLSRFNSE